MCWITMGCNVDKRKTKTKRAMSKWQPTTSAIVLGVIALGKLWVLTVHSHLKASWTADRLMPYLASSFTSWGEAVAPFSKALYLLKHQAKWIQMDPNGTSSSIIQHEHPLNIHITTYNAFPRIFRNIKFFHLAVQDYLAILACWSCKKKNAPKAIVSWHALTNQLAACE